MTADNMYRHAAVAATPPIADPRRVTSQRFTALAAVAAVASWAALGAGLAGAHGNDKGRQAVATPTLAGPVPTPRHLDGTHGIPYTSSAIDLRTHGYTEREYFV